MTTDTKQKERAMTEKKKEKSQSTGKLKKLRLNKETLQDLTTERSGTCQRRCTPHRDQLGWYELQSGCWLLTLVSAEMC
jgi:hypothetical protein